MNMPSSTKEYFDDNASNWDQLRSGFFRPEVRNIAIQKAYLRPEYAVLDMGAGTGFISEAVAPLVRRVYLVDGSEAMLEEAQRNLKHLDNLEFHTADGSHIPLPAESMDVVFANMYLHHCLDPLAAIKEMVRVLRPGGRLVLTDLDEHTHAWLKEEMADTWQGFSRAQIADWFAEADLVNISLDCTGEQCCAQSKSEPAESKANAAEISIFVAAASRRVSGARNAVKEQYHNLAANSSCCSSTASSSCCSSSSPAASSCCSSDASSCCSNSETVSEPVSFETGYGLDEIKPIPAEAAELSLGCGNPISRANLQPGEKVLDIGSGAGLDSLLAARKVGETGFVYGVDMTPIMLEKSRNAASQAKIKHVEFRQGQAEDLPLEAGSVDVVISNCVINLCEDKGKVFTEIFRVLKPGGRMVISDMVSDIALPADAREQAASWAGCIAGALTEAEYLDLIRHAGFETPDTQRSKSGGRLGDVDVYSLEISARKPA